MHIATAHARGTLIATISDYAELLKVRVNSLVVLTSCCGAYLKSGHLGLSLLLNVVAGIGAVACGTAALNQIMERDVDALMTRTSRRPLVTGRINCKPALVMALALVVGGGLWLWFTSNLLTGVLALLTSLVYVLIYTPAKKLGPWCTTVGAVPGAMPILLGWCAAGGALDTRAALLFSLLYLWQFPHFHAIALMYRADYQRSGIRMLAVVDEGGHVIAREILFCSLALVSASVLPFVLHMSGAIYVVVAAVSGIWFAYHSFTLYSALRLGQRTTVLSRNLLRASVIYLPVLLIALSADKIR